MGQIGTAASSARLRGTGAAASQAPRPGVLPIFLVGAAIPCGMWAVMWFLENVVDPGCGDPCLRTALALVFIAPCVAVVGGFTAGALASRCPAWRRSLALIGGLGVAFGLILIVSALVPDPLEWRDPDPIALASSSLTRWLGSSLYLGVPALGAFGLALLVRLVLTRLTIGREPSPRARLATGPEAADGAPGRFWDGRRWVDEDAVPTGHDAVEPEGR